MTNKKWIKSPWAISIGTAIFSFILTTIYDYSKSKPVFSTIIGILLSIWNSIIWVLNFNIKVWWLIIVISVAIVIIYVVIILKKEEIIEPDFCDYKEDKFRIWRWSWEWKFNYSKKSWFISNLTAHCPNCDTSLIDYNNIYEQGFECPRCDYKSDFKCEEPYKIERIILDNIEKMRRKNSK
ncbi:MAG: hypothetical protein E6845_17285 [Clostridium sp.]|uniref:hypothetical protein n=1 Tax=Clostridium sp. TaxID=1506 RepID=UPI0029019714|nr:hypothetical protein [Clostridium sp.]MDU1604713.1 hypothetical protein [Clostridium sp.]